LDLQIEELLQLIARKADNVVATRQLMCSETVLTVINQGLGGGMPNELAVRLGSGFPEGLGESGCLCGAVAGGIMALGLFLGRDRPGLLNNRLISSVSQTYHDRFKAEFGSTCCRVLTRNQIRGTKGQFNHCSEITGRAAEMAAGLILEKKPELVDQADWAYLRREDSMVKARLKQAAGVFKG
jgi:C_GCAxxG_C_C family probable redox protein